MIFLLVAIIGAQFLFNVHIFQRLRKLEDSSLKNIISDGISNINKDATIEPLSGKVYVYEPKLVLPPYPPELSSGVEYTYIPGNVEGFKEELQITSKTAMGYGTARLNQYASEGRLFEAVPIAQACSRQIIIMFNPADEAPFDGYKKVESRQLADGRTLHIFTSNQCHSESEVLTNYIKQIQSY